MKTALIQHNSVEYLEAVALRREVLRKPLGLEFTPEELQAESAEIHVGLWQQDALMAVVSLRPISNTEIKMRQVAVKPENQKLGLGKSLVLFSETIAMERGFRLMTLHARDTAVPFYLKLGYSIIGDPFKEVGIEHRKMVKHFG